MVRYFQIFHRALLLYYSTVNTTVAGLLLIHTTCRTASLSTSRRQDSTMAGYMEYERIRELSCLHRSMQKTPHIGGSMEHVFVVQETGDPIQ